MKTLHGLSVALAVGAALWSMGVGARIWVTPMRSTGTSMVFSSDGSSRVFRTEDVRSFSQISLFGPVPLIVPIVLTGLGALAAWRRRRLALMLVTFVVLAFCFIAGFSIGAFYLPAGAARRS